MRTFSVIIPSYNSLNKIGKTLESLENQSFKDFEVVIIDDFSTDSTYSYLEEYRKKSRLAIKLLKNNQNLGPGCSRNIGIENSDSRFLVFIDSDDYIEFNTLEEISKLTEKYNLDAIIYDYYLIKGKVKVKQKSVLRGQEGFLSTSDSLMLSTGSTCGKIYRTEIIKKYDIRFPNLRRTEDYVFNKLALSKCSEIYYLEKSYYNYLMYDDSLMHDRSLLNENNSKIAFELVSRNLGREFSKELKSLSILMLLYSPTLIKMIKGVPINVIKSDIEEYNKYYPDWYKDSIIVRFSRFQQITLYFINKKKYKLVKMMSILKDLKRN